MTRVFVRFATIGLFLAVRYRGGRWESSVRARALCRTESCSSCFHRACSSPCRFFAVPVLRRAGVGESLGVVLLSLGGRGIAAVVWISTRSLGAVRYL
jgi:hypothetical protein